MTTKMFEAVVERAVATTERKKHSDGRTIYRAVATTAALDRYGEVVLPKGAILENFMKNPVLLDSHNYQKSSVGHVVDVNVKKDAVYFDFVFSTDQAGQDLETKFAMGDMSAFSIGFKPKGAIDLWSPWDEPPEIKEISVEYPDGSTGKVNLRSYEQIPYTIYHKWELLEISPVAVPANPEALLMRAAEGILAKTMADNPVLRSFVKDELAADLAPIMKRLAEFAEKSENGISIDGSIRRHFVTVEDLTWSAADARTELAKWASKSGDGSKENMNWAKFSKGFAEFDVKEVENFGAYKLLHHTVKDGALIAVWKGLTTAMAALLDAGNALSLDSKELDYAHLAGHYVDFGQKAPELKEYTAEELEAIKAQPVIDLSKAAATEEEDPESEDVTEDEDPGEEGSEGDAKEDEAEAKEAAPAPQTLMASMSQMMGLIQKILDTVMVLVQKQEIMTESYQEHFISLQLKTKGIQDMLEYKKLDAKPEVKKEKEVVGEVSEDLIAALERVKTL